jgi:DNA-binding beta-propeller fold protein YncE
MFRPFHAGILATVPLSACLATGGAEPAAEWGGGTAAAWDTASAGASADEDDDGYDAPSESESDYLRLAPAATDQYVFVANPDRDTLTRIAVSTLDVQTVPVGAIPSTVQTTGDYRLAVTLNEGDDSVSIVEAETLAVTTVTIRDNMNQLALSPDGAWAMTWYDPAAESLGTSNGVKSYNEVSFVRTDAPESFPRAVGYSPAGVRWSDDGMLAVVVSDADLAIVDLSSGEPTVRLVALADVPDDAPVAEEVVLSPRGDFAFVRQRGEQDLLVVDLAAGKVDRVPVGSDPTDMDVNPDGDALAVVARAAREVWTFDAADPFAPPVVTPFPSDTGYGSIAFAGDGGRALLYTNASAVARLAIWDIRGGGFEERSLVKPVSVVAISPAGDTAVVFHTREDADDAEQTEFTDAWAVTLMEVAGARENRLLLPAEPTGYSLSDDSRWGFFILDGEPLVEACSFASLIPDLVTLPSEPAFVGVLPGRSVAWASQAHDLGRLSFYDPDATTLDTITGFELNSAIEH